MFTRVKSLMEAGHHIVIIRHRPVHLQVVHLHPAAHQAVHLHGLVEAALLAVVGRVLHGDILLFLNFI